MCHLYARQKMHKLPRVDARRYESFKCRKMMSTGRTPCCARGRARSSGAVASPGRQRYAARLCRVAAIWLGQPQRSGKQVWREFDTTIWSCAYMGGKLSHITPRQCSARRARRRQQSRR